VAHAVSVGGRGDSSDKTESPVPLAEGQTFARYLVDRELGHGGMGRVYLATDTVLGRKVALKALLPERMDGEGPARFAREASLGAMVSHPNVVAVYDYGEAEGRAYIAMEYVEGDTLSAYLGSPSVPLGKRLAWLLDVGRALAEAHDHGLVHRDIKPSNVMVTRAGLVKVLDFGLAKRTRTEAPGAFRTLEGQALGTPRYMAPEQIAGLAVTPRTDQYALGVMAFELLTGQHPSGPTGRDDPPKLLTEIDRSLPFRLAVLVSRMLAKRAEDRYASMHDVNAELERVLAEVSPESLATETKPPADEATLGLGAVADRATLPEPPETARAGAEAPGVRPAPPLGPPDVATARAPMHAPPPDDPRGRAPAGKTLPSAGSDPPPAEQRPADGTLRSADHPSGRPLGLVVAEAASRAEAAARVPKPPPSQAVVLVEPARVSGWSKSMWITVIVVGLVGVVAGALLTGWLLSTSAATTVPTTTPPD
jgi:serine/threonine protein kinase